MGEYVSIPGTKTHELPPLLIHLSAGGVAMPDVLDHAALIVESENMLPAAIGTEEDREHRRLDLAVRLAQQYRHLVSQWQWGDSILEWIEQCEITFSADSTLCTLLQADLWPHAGRSSFVTLLMEKSVVPGLPLDQAVGLRLTFRQPPPIDCFSNQFLFYLNSTVSGKAYEAWSRLGSGAAGLLPPDRFHFEVFDVGRV
jgi:hypothetical protein